jgi:hypothetical protein
VGTTCRPACIGCFHGGLDWFVGPLIRVLARDWPDVCHLDYASSCGPFDQCEATRRVLIGQYFVPWIQRCVFPPFQPKFPCTHI